MISQSDNLKKNSKDSGGKKITRSSVVKRALSRVRSEDWKPEIEVVDTKARAKKAEKKRKEAESSLPPHLKLDTMKKAFAHTNEENVEEGIGDAVKKGVKRHKDAVEKKKIKNRKAVPYAALAAEHEPEGEVIDEKKKGLDGKECWDGYKLAGTKKKGGKTVDNCVKVKEDYYSGTGEKVQKRTLAWMRKKGQKGAPGLDAMKARTAEHKAKRGVKEGTDKAFEYVKKQIAAKYGKSGYVSKDNPRKPQSAADKAKARAHQAKVDAENAAARAKDPSQGRYPKG